jgi:hypothetical protein
MQRFDSQRDAGGAAAELAGKLRRLGDDDIADMIILLAWPYCRLPESTELRSSTDGRIICICLYFALKSAYADNVVKDLTRKGD